MEREKPWLYITLTKGRQARHLLILFLNGSADTELVLMENGVASSLARGTEYARRSRPKPSLRYGSKTSSTLV